MKSKLASLWLVSALLLVLAPFAMASTTWYVDGVHGNDSNDCKTQMTTCKTIGHAISLASSGDTIMVAPATYIENLTIGTSLKVIGSGAATTIIDGGGALDTVVTISNKNADVTLSKVTIQNGSGLNGGGVSNSGTLTIENAVISGNHSGNPKKAGEGGGVDNFGTLTIDNSVITANTANRGGGIQNFGSLTINNTTVSDNTVPTVGGGIENFGKLRINGSTISNNRCCVIRGTTGAGISNVNGATLTVNNSTISGNYGRYGIGNGFAKVTITNSTISGNFVGIQEVHSTATVQNTILANNGNLNCMGTVTSNGYNLSSDGSCNFSGPGDMNNTDPKLGTLGNHGGPTQTIPLLAGGPAIDAGNPSGCTDDSGQPLKTDQRGVPRPDKEDTGGCDIGAFEKQSD